MRRRFGLNRDPPRRKQPGTVRFRSGFPQSTLMMSVWETVELCPNWLMVAVDVTTCLPSLRPSSTAKYPSCPVVESAAPGTAPKKSTASVPARTTPAEKMPVLVSCRFVTGLPSSESVTPENVIESRTVCTS